MVLAVCFDKNFQKWASVALYSVCSQHKRHPKIRLFILTDLSYEDCIWPLKRVLRHFDFILINPGNDFDSLPTGFHFTTATYWRLALPKILADHQIERAIYLDTDILVLESLDELFNFDLNGAACGGAIDISSELVVERLNLNQQFAINGGVLLMDIAKMNTINWIKAADELNELGKIEWVDQDVINIVLDMKIALIDLKFNVQSGHFQNGYTLQPAIVHFTESGRTKPWLKGCRHKYVHAYRRSMLFCGLFTDYFHAEERPFRKIAHSIINELFFRT